MALFEEERANAQIARKIYDHRTRAGLTQRQLAKLVGTTASRICRLEDADYDGHSPAMLWRIATALNQRTIVLGTVTTLYWSRRCCCTNVDATNGVA